MGFPLYNKWVHDFPQKLELISSLSRLDVHPQGSFFIAAYERHKNIIRNLDISGKFYSSCDWIPCNIQNHVIQIWSDATRHQNIIIPSKPLVYFLLVLSESEAFRPKTTINTFIHEHRIWGDWPWLTVMGHRLERANRREKINPLYNLWLYPSFFSKTAWFSYVFMRIMEINSQKSPPGFSLNFPGFSWKLLKKLQRCCTSFLEFPVRLESFSANSRACRTRSSWL